MNSIEKAIAEFRRLEARYRYKNDSVLTNKYRGLADDLEACIDATIDKKIDDMKRILERCLEKLSSI